MNKNDEVINDDSDNGNATVELSGALVFKLLGFKNFDGMIVDAWSNSDGNLILRIIGADNRLPKTQNSKINNAIIVAKTVVSHFEVINE